MSGDLKWCGSAIEDDVMVMESEVMLFIMVIEDGHGVHCTYCQEGGQKTL